MSLLSTSAIQQLWFLLLVPLLTRAKPLACSSADNTCSTQDALPTLGDALLQRLAKRNKSASADPVSRPSHLPHNYPSGKSMMEIAQLNRVISERDLPPGTKELFNEKLCNVKHGGYRAAEPSDGTAKINPSSPNIATDAFQSAGAAFTAASTKLEYFPLSGAATNDDAHDANGDGMSRDNHKEITSALSRDHKMKNMQDIFRVGKGKKKSHQSHQKTIYLQEANGMDGPSRMQMLKKGFNHGEEEKDSKDGEEKKGFEDGGQEESETTGGFTKSFFSDYEISDMPSMNAPLDESGYKLVVAQNNDDEMKIYIRRVAQSCDMKVIDEGGLNGAVAWFSGVNASSSFAELKLELFSALLAKSQDNWVSVRNRTGISGNTASLDLIGFVQVRSLRSAKEMVKYVRRMVEHMGIKIVNDGGFDGMMHYYSEPDDMQSFQRLMSEIKQAVFMHSWAEVA